MPAVILWGPPCSGKTTHVEQRIRPGDVVIDLDRIALALDPNAADHDYPDHVRRMAQAARRAIIDDVVAWGVRSQRTAWVIDSAADQVARAKWRRRGATVVELEVDHAECVRRAAATRPPGYARAVDAWFARHAADAPRPRAASSRRWS